MRCRGRVSCAAGCSQIATNGRCTQRAIWRLVKLGYFRCFLWLYMKLTVFFIFIQTTVLTGGKTNNRLDGQAQANAKCEMRARPTQWDECNVSGKISFSTKILHRQDVYLPIFFQLRIYSNSMRQINLLRSQRTALNLKTIRYFHWTQRTFALCVRRTIRRALSLLHTFAATFCRTVLVVWRRKRSHRPSYSIGPHWTVVRMSYGHKIASNYISPPSSF